MSKIVQSRMRLSERYFHRLMIFCTLGLWTPVYLTRKHRIERTSQIR
jgi:hypothetical protein